MLIKLHVQFVGLIVHDKLFVLRGFEQVCESLDCNLLLSCQLRVERLAEEKAKKKVATKRQEELELRKKQEEAARKKKLQQAVSPLVHPQPHCMKNSLQYTPSTLFNFLSYRSCFLPFLLWNKIIF